MTHLLSVTPHQWGSTSKKFWNKSWRTNVRGYTTFDDICSFACIREGTNSVVSGILSSKRWIQQDLHPVAKFSLPLFTKNSFLYQGDIKRTTGHLIFADIHSSTQEITAGFLGIKSHTSTWRNTWCGGCVTQAVAEGNYLQNHSSAALLYQAYMPSITYLDYSYQWFRISWYFSY